MNDVLRYSGEWLWSSVGGKGGAHYSGQQLQTLREGGKTLFHMFNFVYGRCHTDRFILKRHED